MDPEDLIPKLPKPRDLQPFPTTQALVSSCAEPGGDGCTVLCAGCCRAGGRGGEGVSADPHPPPFPFLPQVYRGHSSLVRCLSVSPSGQWLASGTAPHRGGTEHFGTAGAAPEPCCAPARGSARVRAVVGGRMGGGSPGPEPQHRVPQPLAAPWVFPGPHPGVCIPTAEKVSAAQPRRLQIESRWQLTAH